ncbi:MAG TPA: PAS domain S-box protein [Rhodocyclaceae bacterium]|nr:PAS domain S-box protein [Rhodocyclaceae bacterium]
MSGPGPDRRPGAAAGAADVFLAVLDAFTANIAVLDGNGIILAVNRAWRDFAAVNGAPELAVHSVGASYRDACALPASAGGGHFPGWIGIAEVLSGARPSFTLEYPCNSSDEGRWFVMNVHRLPAPQCGVVVVHEDITVRKRMESKLRGSEERLRLLVENAPAAIAMFDRDLRYLCVSRRFLEDFRVPERDVIGRNHFDIFPEVPQRWRDILERCLAGESAEANEDSFQRRDGRTDWVRWAIRPWSAASGEVGGLVLFCENITARKEAEDALRLAHEEAERANRAKSRFLAAASHDLRQPLSALRLYVDVLEHKLPAADQSLHRSMKECVDSLGALLTDLLDLSKLDAGVIKPSASDFAVVDLFARIEAAYAPEARLKRISLRFRESGLIAHADATLYGRMLGNLVANAVRYTERGGVLVGCRRRGGKLWVEVWDTGIGIPLENLDEIFEEFRQLGGRQHASGSGLGLAIVSKTAALLGLEMRVRSRPGKGSMFALELPPGRMRPTRTAGAMRYRPVRIALVENTSLVRDALAYALEAVGHQVVAAAGGPELIARLGDRAPDIVISDYRLGEHESGFDVIKALKARFGAQLPGVIITGDTDSALMRSMADRGIVVHHKPVDLDVLRMCIEELTESDDRTRSR